MAAGLPIFADAKSFGFRSCIGVFCKIWVAQRCQSNSLSRLWCVFRTRSKNSCAFGAWICLNSISVSETDFSDSFRPCSILRLATFWLSCRVSPAFLGQVSPCEGPSAVWISVDARMYQRCVKLCSFGDRLPFLLWFLAVAQHAECKQVTFYFPSANIGPGMESFLCHWIVWRNFLKPNTGVSKNNLTLSPASGFWQGRRMTHSKKPPCLLSAEALASLSIMVCPRFHIFDGTAWLCRSKVSASFNFLALSEWFAFTTVTIEFKRSVFQCQSQLVNPFDSSIFGCLHPQLSIGTLVCMTRGGNDYLAPSQLHPASLESWPVLRTIIGL